MIKIDVRSTLGQQAESLRRMSRELQDKAVAMALNKTISKGKTEMTRAITSEFNIKAGTVRPQLMVKKAFAKRGILIAELGVVASRNKGRSANLIHFLKAASVRNRSKNGRQHQLSFQIKRAGAKHIPGAFIGNEGRTVFIRTGKARLPIEAVQTIGVAQMFNTRRLNERVVGRIEKEFQIEFGRAVQLLLRGGK